MNKGSFRDLIRQYKVLAALGWASLTQGHHVRKEVEADSSAVPQCIDPLTLSPRTVEVFNPNQFQRPVTEIRGDDPHFDEIGYVHLGEETPETREDNKIIGYQGLCFTLIHETPHQHLFSVTDPSDREDSRALIREFLEDRKPSCRNFNYNLSGPKHYDTFFESALGLEVKAPMPDEMQVIVKGQVVSPVSNEGVMGYVPDPENVTTMPPIMPVRELEKMIRNFQSYPLERSLNPPVSLPVDEEQSYGPKPQPNPYDGLIISTPEDTSQNSEPEKK